MYFEVEKVKRSQEILQNIAKGVNPYSGEQVQDDSLLGDTRTTACFNYIAEVLENMLKRGTSWQRKEMKFVISPEQKSKVVLTEGKIGVNEFSRCINTCINLEESRKLTGVEVNKRLKKLGILSEENLEEGKKKTVTNERSVEYGFEIERKSYKGMEYDMVLMNNTGKKYLLENLETIMAVEL